MKRLFYLVFLGLFACGLISAPQPAPALAPLPTLTATASLPVAPLGSDQNPLILALAPSTHPSPAVDSAGQVLGAQLAKSTGYKIVVVIPPNESELVRAFGIGNAHIGVLSPFGYLRASEQGHVVAAFARKQAGNLFYGAQFIVRSDAGFISYYDPIAEKDLADAPVALAQFRGKKPCWADEFSPSGYVVPLGFLNTAGVSTLAPAFVAGQPTVVRAVYASGVCDFGATYIDARTYPGLEDNYPDVMKKILVVWRIPAIIPYETLVFVNGMTIDMQRALIRAFVDTMSTPDGKSAMQTLYGFDAMDVVQDGQYAEFRKAVRAAGLDLNTLVK
jgi:ABC-type phosphate/phosphonate transport system substrate-binding protein